MLRERAFDAGHKSGSLSRCVSSSYTRFTLNTLVEDLLSQSMLWLILSSCRDRHRTTEQLAKAKRWRPASRLSIARSCRRLAQRPSRLPDVYASNQREIIDVWNPTRPPYSA
jgi:hypothetical protein